MHHATSFQAVPMQQLREALQRLPRHQEGVRVYE
jgi:hypothetical protein